MLLSYSTTRRKCWIYRSIFEAKLIKSIFMCIQIIKSYIYQTHICQSVESLRSSSISKLDNMLKSNSVFNTKCAEFSSKCRTTCTCNHLPDLQQKFVSPLQPILTSLFYPSLVQKTTLTIPTNTPSLSNSAFLSFFLLHTVILKFSTKSYFYTSVI